MAKSMRGRYTLEFKQEAGRLVESGQSQAAAARSLGVVEQTLGDWVSEYRAGTLKGAGSKPQVTAEQMKNSRRRLLAGRQRRRPPHIYSDREIEQLMAEAARLPSSSG